MTGPWRKARGQSQNPGILFWRCLWERGAVHEQNYVEHLKAGGLDVIRIEGIDVNAEAVAATIQAMQSGVPVIVQGAALFAW